MRPRRFIVGVAICLAVIAAAAIVVPADRSGDDVRGALGRNSGVVVDRTIELGPRGQVTAILPTPDGDVWVAGYRVPGTDRLWRLDGETGRVVAIVRLRGVPGWEVGGDGMAADEEFLWVGGSGDEGALLHRIDLSRDRLVATSRVPGRSVADVAIGESGVWATVFNAGERVSVVQLDSETHRVEASVPVTGNWIREIFAFDGTVIARSQSGPARLTTIDPANGHIQATRELRLGVGASTFGASSGAVWTAADGKLIRIDPRTALPRKSISVGQPISGIGVDVDAGLVWLVGQMKKGQSEVIGLDLESERIEARAPVQRAPVALAASDDAVWLLNYDGSVTRMAVD